MSMAIVRDSSAAEALRLSPLPALRSLSVEETGSVILIRGMVPSYYLKQMAQETVMPVLAGRSLLNRVTVGAG